MFLVFALPRLRPSLGSWLSPWLNSSFLSCCLSLAPGRAAGRASAPRSIDSAGKFLIAGSIPRLPVGCGTSGGARPVGMGRMGAILGRLVLCWPGVWKEKKSDSSYAGGKAAPPGSARTFVLLDIIGQPPSRPVHAAAAGDHICGLSSAEGGCGLRTFSVHA